MKTQIYRHISKNELSEVIRKDLKTNRTLYLIILPVLVYYIIFCYVPMYGAVIAFQNYSPGNGFISSNWIGFKHFRAFFESPDFCKLLRNTISINFTSLIFGFPAPIILALLLNELKSDKFKRFIQTISYMPHFISIVVICGLIKNFVGFNGVISNVYNGLTGNSINMLERKEMFVPIYVISDIWQQVGWSSIIYIAALTGIDAQLYEAARIDGAGKFKQILCVTIPGIAPTIIIMLILAIGSMMSLGFEKIFLLYNPLILDKADVISTYVYRMGFNGGQWSYTTAIGLFNSTINLILLAITNTISKTISGTSLW